MVRPSHTPRFPRPIRPDAGSGLLASLRLTVVLFAASIFLIFVGTLAQKDQDVSHVVNDTYFRVWFARVDFRVFGRFAQIFYKASTGICLGTSTSSVVKHLDCVC